MSADPDMMHLLDDDEYTTAIRLCEAARDAARSRDGGPTVAGSFLGRLRLLLVGLGDPSGESVCTYRIQKLREERERIERRIWDDQQRLRQVFVELSAEVTAEAEGR